MRLLKVVFGEEYSPGDIRGRTGLDDSEEAFVKAIMKTDAT